MEEQYGFQEAYIKAYHFAALAHEGQKYLGTRIPYLLHLSLVAMEVQAALAAEPDSHVETLAIQCALLHDTIEDTRVVFETLEEEFGVATAFGVLALSKNPDLAKPEQMPDSLQRILKEPHEVWMVKLADRITNMQKPPHFWKLAKRQAYQAEARVILKTLRGASPYLEARLEAKIEAYNVWTTGVE